MATIGEAISSIRRLIKEDSDDTKYQDEFLYSLLRKARAVILRREADKRKKLSKWNYQRYCVTLEKTKSHDCGCVKVGCDVLRSSFEIPKPLNIRSGDIYKILTLGECEIPYTETYLQKYNVLDEIKADSPYHSIVNDKIVIWNELNLDCIIIEGIFEDPTDWEAVPLCGQEEVEEGAEDSCYNPLEDDFPLDEEYHLMAYEYVLNLLRIPLSTRNDETGDTNETIRS